MQCKFKDANMDVSPQKQCLLPGDDQGSLKKYAFKEKDQICYQDENVNDKFGSREISNDECETVFNDTDTSEGILYSACKYQGWIIANL